MSYASCKLNTDMYIIHTSMYGVKLLKDKALLKVVADRSRSTPSQKEQLQRFDWLLAALEVFVTEGVDEVRITRLAQDLGVTRGSFYWHFTNRTDLIEALVDYWKEKNTPAIVDSVTHAENLSSAILGFFETCIDIELFDPRLDLAIREWARRSEKIRVALDQADETRIQAFTKLFIDFNYPMPDALIRARILYFAQIGYYALEVTEPLEDRLNYTDTYFENFTGRKLNTNERDDFIKRVLEKFGGKL